jgi:uncharacterized protein YecE (DUF72 family)
MTIDRYHLGCPVWGRRDWVGELFRPGTRSSDYLAQYARVFNAVEGNTTFYATPSPEVVERWRQQTPESFAFCFKFPKTITHDKLLRGARREAEAFVRRIAPLGPRLGPVMVQLPAVFGPRDLPILEDFLVQLPGDGPGYAVEVRHPDLYAGAAADELDAVLESLRVDRVILDTTGLFRAHDDDDPALVQAQQRKPRVPLRPVTTARRPIVRYIGEPHPMANEDLLDAWAGRVAEWIDRSLHPYVFVHAPDDHWAPRLGAAFHNLLARRTSTIGELPRFPTLVDPRGEQMKLL